MIAANFPYFCIVAVKKLRSSLLLFLFAALRPCGVVKFAVISEATFQATNFVKPFFLLNGVLMFSELFHSYLLFVSRCSIAERCR